MRRVLLCVLGLFLLLFTLVMAHDVNKTDKDTQDKSTTTTSQMSNMNEHVIYTMDNIKWGDVPPGLPAGAQAAVLDGDPGKPELFTVRLKMPDNYKIAPHFHSSEEHLTVISGTFLMAYGDKWDDNSLKEVPAGGFAVMPKSVHHYASTHGETVLQIHGMGPFDITYLNPSDDPRQQHAGTAK